MYTGEELKTWRKRLGLTQEEVATYVREHSDNKRFGQQAIYKIEKAQKPRSAYLLLVIKALETAEQTRKQQELERTFKKESAKYIVEFKTSNDKSTDVADVLMAAQSSHKEIDPAAFYETVEQVKALQAPDDETIQTIVTDAMRHESIPAPQIRTEASPPVDPDLATQLLKRMSRLFFSGRLTSADLALIQQMVERLAGAR